MATKLFLRSSLADTTTGMTTNLVGSTTVGQNSRALSTTAGAGVVASANTATVAGPTAGIEITLAAGRIGDWLTPPLSADVTISGAITGNIWAAESSNSANVAINFVVDVIRATDGSVVQIVKSARTTEVALTTRAVNNFTATPGAGVLVNKGDRIRVRIFGDDSTTMGSGFTFNIGYNGGTGAADGDTFISFTETFSFGSASAGTQIFFTDTASAVSTASIDKEAWTSRGGGVTNVVTDVVNGPVTPTQVQVTNTSAGTVVDWFTRPLTAFTLAGIAQANLRGLESDTLANATLRCELARVDNDGTNPSVWGMWCLAPAGSDEGELGTVEAAQTANVSGDDLAFTNGQRLRIRLYLDDCPTSMSAAVARTVTFFYAGTSGGASGDSFVTLSQSVTEFAATSIEAPPLIAEQAVNRSNVY